MNAKHFNKTGRIIIVFLQNNSRCVSNILRMPRPTGYIPTESIYHKRKHIRDPKNKHHKDGEAEEETYCSPCYTLAFFVGKIVCCPFRCCCCCECRSGFRQCLWMIVFVLFVIALNFTAARIIRDSPYSADLMAYRQGRIPFPPQKPSLLSEWRHIAHLGYQSLEIITQIQNKKEDSDRTK
jgi:hypothetical protein